MTHRSAAERKDFQDFHRQQYDSCCFFFPLFLQPWLDFMQLCSFCGSAFSQGRTFLLHPRTLLSKQDNGKNLLWFLHTLVSGLADYLTPRGNRNEVSRIKTENDKRLCRQDVTKMWNGVKCVFVVTETVSYDHKVNASWLGLFIHKVLECTILVGSTHKSLVQTQLFPKILNWRLIRFKHYVVLGEVAVFCTAIVLMWTMHSWNRQEKKLHGGTCQEISLCMRHYWLWEWKSCWHYLCI